VAGPYEAYFRQNITHNLTAMADAAGIYKHLWHPEELGIKTAGQLVDPLLAGLRMLQAKPARFQNMNPSNGWGSYNGLVRAVEEILAACQHHPDALVRVSI